MSGDRMHDSHGRKRERFEQPIELVPVQFPLAVLAAEPTTPRAINQIAKRLQRLAPVRRGPQILGPVGQRLPNSRVFALTDDPFADVASSDQVRAVESNSAAVISQVKSPDRSRRVRSVTIEPTAVRDSMNHPGSIDSVLAVPCQPADAAISVPTPCIEFDLFSNLSNRIFPQFP